MSTNKRFDKRIGVEELSRISKENVYPFTLNSELCYGRPVVKYNIDGKDLFFIVDTGSKYNALSNSGLEKLGYNVYDFQTEILLPLYLKSNVKNPAIIQEVNNKNKVVIDKLLQEMINSFDYGKAYLVNIKGSKWAYGRDINKKFDGILGQAFLKQYKNVTFDFKNYFLILNDEKIKKNIIKMDWNKYSHLTINFRYGDSIEPAIIDTGAISFTPRNNFGKKKLEPINNKEKSITPSDVKNYKEKKLLPIVHTYNNLFIGDMEFNNVKGKYANIIHSGYDKNMRMLLVDISCIGCAMFDGHILQLDYENMEMSISE